MTQTTRAALCRLQPVSIDCRYALIKARGSESSSSPSTVQTQDVSLLKQGRSVAKGPFEKKTPKKAAGVSMLSQLLTGRFHQDLRRQTHIRPPPGFEHCARGVTNDLHHGNNPSTAQTIRVQPPPGFEYIFSDNNSEEVNRHPPAELFHLCPPGHPSR